MLILGLVLVLAACDTAKEFTLKIDATEGGTVTPKPGTYKHPENTLVDLKVVADDGYEFTKWEGDKVAIVDAEKGEYKIKMDGNKSIKAVFVEITEEPGEPGEPEVKTLIDFEEGIEGWIIDDDMNQGDVTFSHDTEKADPEIDSTASLRVEYSLEKGQVVTCYFDNNYNLPHAIYYLRVFVPSDADFGYFRPYIQVIEKDEEGDDTYPLYPKDNVPYLSNINTWRTLEIDMTGIPEDAKIFKIGFQIGASEGKEEPEKGTFWVDDMTYVIP